MKTELIKLDGEKTISVLEDTQYVIDMSGLLTGSLTLLFEKEGISAEIISLYFLHENEKLKLTTVACHKAPHTSCLTKIKGVVEKNTVSDYVGKIIIDKHAQQTSSFLDHNVLVIGENAKTNSQPILEIDADDVKASHGATTGTINSDQLYYLKSRGLNEDESKKLIIAGFVETLLMQVNDAKIRGEIRNALNI